MKRTSFVAAAIAYLLFSSANAATYAVAYTGTVGSVVDFDDGEAPPLVIAPGSVVNGQFQFDTDSAAAPFFTYTSCSGGPAICGTGSAQTGYYRFASSLTHSVTIEGITWTRNLGNVWLGEGGLNPAGISQTIGVEDSDSTGRFPSLGVWFQGAVGATTLFMSAVPFVSIPESLSAVALSFENARDAYGTVWSGGPDGYAINFSVQPTTVVPLPATAPLLATGLGLVLLRFRKRTTSLQKSLET